MASEEDRETARQALLFAAAPEDVADQLFERSPVREFDQGETIFLQDDPAEFVFVVLAGWVKLFRISQQGSEAIVGVFTQGQSFGEAVAFQKGFYPVAAEAVTNCRLLQVRIGVLQEVMHARPELYDALLAAIFRHLHSLVGQIQALKAQSGAQRVAEFLLELCSNREGCESIILPYDKSLIAGRLGLKPESLSRAFGRLRERGVQIQKNHADIADIAALRAFVESDRGDIWRNQG